MMSHEAADAERRTDGDTIRNYHGVRNEVHDKASGRKALYTDVVEGKGLSAMIDARRMAVGSAVDQTSQREN